MGRDITGNPCIRPPAFEPRWSGPNLLFSGDERALEGWSTSELIDKKARVAALRRRVQKDPRRPKSHESGIVEALLALEAELQRR